PCMEKYLKDTYGITVYQEQVMLLSRQLANFTRGESDALRKAMGKKKKDIVDAMKPKFIEGGKKNGHDPKILEKIWADWEKFASYAFNKSHAACYSWVAYQTAYLKANYPKEFMAALLTRRRTDIKETTKLLDECKAMGITVKGPSVNDSRQTFNVTKDGSISYAFSAISGIGDGAADEIVREREANGEYSDIYDFVKRINHSAVNSKCIENLANSGAFDCLGLPREQYNAPDAKGFPFFKTLITFGQQYQAAKREAQHSLFGDFEAVEISNPKPPAYTEMSHIHKLNIERDLIGIYLSGHPLDEFKAVLTSYCNTTCKELNPDKENDENKENDEPIVNNAVNKKEENYLERLRKKGDNFIGGIVTKVRTGVSKKGNLPYGIVTLEDYSGTGEIFFFDKIWSDNAGIMTENATICVRGRVEPRSKYNAELTFRPMEVQQLGKIQLERLEGIKLNIRAEDIDILNAKELITEIKDHPGKHIVKVEIATTGNYRPLNFLCNATKVAASQKLIDRLNNIPNVECTAIWNR
ncbi:MAG: DNA polymerase III subunit alpha, partial [Bacteroidaceae bacterium]|nr:DNA polymerase III subunit alpha [Bacteroidaceae bacterium]